MAERRKLRIEKFLDQLFSGAGERIAHCDLVYTFFHPTFSDMEETDIHIKKLKRVDPAAAQPFAGHTVQV